MPRVVVPVEVLEGEMVSAGLVGLLESADVTVVGYHVVPEQTSPEQMQEQYGERAQEALEDLAEEFRAAGGEADYRLVFTHDREQSVDRVVDEVDAEAVAITGTTGAVERLLVSLSGDVAIDRITAFVAAVAADRPIEVTLLSATEEAAADPGRIEAVAEALADAGVDVVAVTAVDDSPLDALVNAVPGHDAVVLGERSPSLSSIVLGDFEERVAAATVGPVLVVQRPTGEAAGDEDGSDADSGASESPPDGPGVDSGADMGSGDAESDSAESDGAGTDGAESNDAESDGAGTDGAESNDAESEDAEGSEQ